AGAVGQEVIVGVLALVGKHEVEAVPEVAAAGVVADDGAGGELQVDAVPVAPDQVALDPEVVRAPGVNRVPGEGLGGATAPNPVAPHHAAGGARQVDAEEGVDQGVVLDPASAGITDLDR